MKKLFLAITILFAVSVKAQDTTYYMKRNKFYMEVKQQLEVTNPTDKEHALFVERKKRKRKDRVFTIVTTTIFASLSVWFWSGYHQ